MDYLQYIVQFSPNPKNNNEKFGIKTVNFQNCIIFDSISKVEDINT
jgi:hypothetical protein